ncbi:hypothetical protein Scep_028964 [Stephania cephalantha]|uniref:DNA topoisomerase (ATP-hydrolyzing) n=1 Tax=Stephania cephalantha TaxID=152367 RepID=A0AAP0EFI5_9MAGN
MAGKRDHTNPSALLNRIKDFTRSLVLDLSNGRSPVVTLGRYRNHCSDPTGNCGCGSDQCKGVEVISLRREFHARRLDVLLRVLVIVQKLLQENKHGSKRDIYYMHPSVFSDQTVVDRAINDICILLRCSRHNLNVVSVGKGLVMGWLRFSESGRTFDCLRRPSTAHPVPVYVEDVMDIVSVAKYILVVEKEAVFNRLANDRFCDTNRCIIITGRGYPDIPTRRFLRLLVEKLQLPVYCLVDCDPYGFDILTTYRFGSMTRGKLSPCCRGAICNKHQYGELTTFSFHDRSELETMLQSGVKFEIEALSVTSISLLSDEYIPSKLQVEEEDEEPEDLNSRKNESASVVAELSLVDQVNSSDMELANPYAG